MHRELAINVDELVDCLECIKEANNDQVVGQTIDEVITVVYDLARTKLKRKIELFRQRNEE